MSWRAVRYRETRERSKRLSCDPRMETTRHHVPPQTHGAKFILEKPRYLHEAYHTLFNSAESYEECCRILLQEWWTPPNE